MFDRHDELCRSSKSCSLMTTPSTIIKKQFDRSQLGLSMMIILATCSLILVLTLPIASFAQELCRGKMPTWKQRLCRDKTSTFQPSWCRFQNPFASVPFLFSDGRFPQLPSAESGIVCETSVSGVLSMLNGTIIGSGGDGSHPVISPRDKCKYITKINTLEFDRLPEGENRYVVFGLVSGEIVLVNFNKDKAFLAGKTSDRSTVQFMDAIAHNGSNILIATISKENAVSLFTGEMTGSPDSINACPYRQEPSHMQPLDVRFTVYMGKVYLGVLYYNHQDRKFRLRFNLLDGCEISSTQFLQFDILAPFTSNLSFRPFSQSGLFGNTFTTASAQKFRLLLQFTTKKHVKIVEFLPQNSSIYYHVDMTQVDSSSFYVAAEDEEITGATIANEFIRRIDLEKSTCENIVGNPSQGLNLVLSLKKPNYSHYLKARNLLEFGVYAFYNDTNRVFDNPAGRANTSLCSIVNGTFWNSETQKCQESFNIETKLEGFLENENVLEIRSRYYDVPSNFSFILNQDLTEMIDVEKTCTIGGVIIPQCEKLLNGSNCYFQALNKLGQLFVPQFLQDYMVNQIFISKSGKEILVYGLQQELCSMNALVMESYNKIRLVGESEFLEASSNAQHLFVTVWRERWELQSQQRFYNICQTLKSNPEDQFLKPFQSACSSTPEAIPVNLNHFGQYTSSCFSGMSCPSIRKVILNTVPEGHYTERPNAVKECEVSNFCVSGVQQPCPPGFMCPFKGMTKPIACSFDTVNTASDIDTREVSQWPGPKGSSTCARKGTSFPEPCPNGTFCITPYFPALPISPGLYIQDQSTIKKCEIGDYCNLGRFVVSGEDAATNQTSLKCPEQTYCENPSIVEPTVCIPTSNLSLYCPPGTSTRNLCAPGFYCPRPTENE
ncbi:hypothetical protein C9374_004976 [Naegleria lovaniensis]|uniref:Uncharacterized protein n=1 Tax=Naegleria lovaniensis TaxID=51637 RepID=A0AA88GL87_NAELO|nr:uncharacterized protein C9374_004976 [Naegleria lovaniensis]KAG2383009.1 hypothetical protein C9374_004976 [Naegleria lovaniensis]